MSSEIFEEIYASLDYLVLTTADNEHFVGIIEPPDWFKNFVPGFHKGSSIKIAEFSLFLENFLIDAELHWQQKKTGLLKSGPWIEKDRDKEEWPLEASVIYVQNKKVLLLALLGTEFVHRQNQQQLARENLLTQEKLEWEVHRRTEQIRSREEEIAFRLIGAAGYRDEETGAHIRRIGLYAAAMAKSLGWTQSQIDELKLAAPMHDMGKIGIADNILLKRGRLNEAEFDTMKKHAQIGGDMLSGSGIPMLDTAAKIANCHHERWDGTGYPKGLKGEQIPEAARIVAIVDVYDALVHKRVYKEAIGEQETLQIMTEMSGSHLDPNLFEVFLSIIEPIRAIKQQNPDDS